MMANIQFNTSQHPYFAALGVLGTFIFFLGFALLLPALIAFVYGEPTIHAFLLTAAIAFVTGGLLYIAFRPEHELRVKEGFIVVSFTWLFLSLVGALPFTISGILPSYTDAVFETMSGLTTTGATIMGGATSDGLQNPSINTLPKSILFWRSLAHWLGGMGIIVLSIAILPLLGVGGMQLFQAESPGPSTDKITPRVQQTAKLLWSIYVLFTFVEFLLLWVHPSMNWFEAINHAFATLATGGFSTEAGSIQAFDSVYIDTVITIFMFMAGINFAMHYRLLTREVHTFISNSEIRFYASITLAAVTIIGGSLWLNHQDYSIGEALRYGSFQAVSIITTTGFGTSNYELWPPLALFFLFLLFFTGGCAGSTGGGIKMIRWEVLIKNSFREIKQNLHPKAILPLRLGDKTINPSMLRSILSFFVLYILIFGVGAMIIAATGFDIISSIGASIACIGNIGPGFGAFGPTDNYAQIPYFGKWVLIFLMMIGRLELFTVLILFSPSFWE